MKMMIHDQPEHLKIRSLFFLKKNIRIAFYYCGCCCFLFVCLFDLKSIYQRYCYQLNSGDTNVNFGTVFVCVHVCQSFDSVELQTQNVIHIYI